MALPFAFAYGLGPETVAGTSLVLPANGGTVALWVPLSDRIAVVSGTLRTLDTSGSHTLEVALWADDALAAIRGSVVGFTFTASAAANRTGNLTPPVVLNAGMAWLIIRNSGVTTTSLASVAHGTFGATDLALTATIAQSLAVADLNAVVWAQATAVPLVRLNGTFTPVSGGQFG